MHRAEFSPSRYMDDTMKKGIVSAIVIHHIKKNKGTYPYALLKSFKKSGHPFLCVMDKSQVYNLLNALEHDGFVKSKASLVGAKMQKVYSVTPKGSAYASSFMKIFYGFVSRAKILVKREFSE